MGELHPLGVACRPRRVDDGADVVGLDPCEPRCDLGELLLSPLHPRRHVGIDGDDSFQRPTDLECRCQLRARGDGQHRLAVGDDLIRDLGRRAGIDRYGHSTRGLDSQIAVQPLEPVRGHQDDAVAGLHARVHQGGCDGEDIPLHIGPCLNLPRLADLVMNERPIAIACRLAEEHADGGAVGDTFGVQLAGCGLRCPYGHLGLAT